MIAAFLNKYRPDGPWTLSAIVPDGKIETQTFTDTAQAGVWALAANETKNVYVGVNPTIGPVNKKATKEQIAALEFFHVDVDLRAGEDFDEERSRILRLLTISLPAGVPPPTCIVDSGGGFNAYWRLAEPVPINGDIAKAEEAERWNRALENLFGADACHNCDRILRLPGTTNWPNKKKLRNGRKPTTAEVYAWPAADAYPLSAFEIKLPPIKQAALTITGQRNVTQAQPKARTLGDPLSVGTEDLQRWATLNRATLPDMPLARIADGDASAFGNDRSDMVFYVCAELDRAGVPPQLIASAIYDKGNLIHAHVWEKGGRTPWAYAQRQVMRARESNQAKAAETGGHGVVENARRAHQIEENRRIGEGDRQIPAAELIDLDTALSRFVFCADGSRVVDIYCPHYDLQLSDWEKTYAASTVSVSRPPKTLANGQTKEQAPAEVPLTKLWMKHSQRRTVITRTFKAGGALVLPDPAGRVAVNSWRPFDRSTEVPDLEAAGVGLFVEHVEFLFGPEASRFLDWLAHIEQKPGELPHTAWLHIARTFGMGRNWLASVLTRVWAGSVAPNFDLVATLKTGFNGGLSRKVLAVVDEIREGGRDAQWEHSEKMKSLITEETRTINPKYGRQSVEFNSCRWLLFSNHLSAIPLETGDRRIEVVQSELTPRAPDYYVSLYRALNDSMFIAAVAAYLGRRDITGFNAGAHAKLSDAKAEAIQASQSPDAYLAELVARHWPCDVAPSKALAAVFSEGIDGTAVMTAAQRRALQSNNILTLEPTYRLADGVTRVYIVRNKEKWKAAPSSLLRAEWERGEAQATRMKTWSGWRQFLLGCAAGRDGEEQGGLADALPF